MQSLSKNDLINYFDSDIEHYMSYYGNHGTVTPEHMDKCRVLGFNVMTYSTNSEHNPNILCTDNDINMNTDNTQESCAI
jgi:hypothetical protein